MPAAACLVQDPYRTHPPTLALGREGPPAGASRPAGTRLLDPVRAAIRLRRPAPRAAAGRERWAARRASRAHA